MQTVQILVPLRLTDGHLILVKIEELETPPRPGDKIWDASFDNLMRHCDKRLTEITVEESGVDLDENIVILMCREIVLDAPTHKMLAGSTLAGWGNDYEFERN